MLLFIVLGDDVLLQLGDRVDIVGGYKVSESLDDGRMFPQLGCFFAEVWQLVKGFLHIFKVVGLYSYVFSLYSLCNSADKSVVNSPKFCSNFYQEKHLRIAEQKYGVCYLFL